MFGRKSDLVRGYRYTTSVSVRYGDAKELRKIAKRENRSLRRNNCIERLVVYPVPGQVPGIGQLCVLR